MKSLLAYEKIRDLILSGQKLPGTRLVLSDLEDELGIGRGPIREALMRLDRSGLVRNVPYKGAVVAPPPKKKEIDYIFSIRVDLEVRLAMEAIDKISDEKIAELERVHEEMRHIGRDFYALDRTFHNIIYEASDLPHLCLIVHKLIESVETFLNLFQHDLNDCESFIDEHAAILEALRMRDGEKLKASLTRNIESGIRRIEKAYAMLMQRPE